MRVNLVHKVIFTLIILLFTTPSWAATCAGTCDAKTQALLDWLTQNPTKYLFSQMVANTDSGVLTSWAGHIDDINTDYGEYPAVAGYQWVSGNMDGSTLTKYADYCNARGLVIINWHPKNPWKESTSETEITSLFPAVDDYIPAGEDVLDLIPVAQGGTGNDGTGDGYDEYDAFHGEMDHISTAISGINSAGCSVLFSVLDEPSGYGFWWTKGQGTGSRVSPADYKTLHDYVYYYLNTTKGNQNILRVWMDNAYFGSTSADRGKTWEYFPGADKLDIASFSAHGVASVITIDRYNINSTTWKDVANSWTQYGANPVYYQAEGHPKVDGANWELDDTTGADPSKASSLANCVATANTFWWAWDDTNNQPLLYIHTHDGASPGTDFDIIRAKEIYPWYQLLADETDDILVGVDNTFDCTIAELLAHLGASNTLPNIALVNFWADTEFTSKSDYATQGQNFVDATEVLTRDELIPDPPTVSAPAQGASGILTYPTITGSTFYGPRAHYQTTYQVDAVSNGDTDCSTADWSGLAINVATANELTTKSTWPTQLSDNSYYCARVRYGINVDGSATWGEWSENTIDDQYDGNYFETGTGGGDPGLSGKTIGLGGSNTVSLGGSKTLDLVSE